MFAAVMVIMTVVGFAAIAWAISEGLLWLFPAIQSVVRGWFGWEAYLPTEIVPEGPVVLEDAPVRVLPRSRVSSASKTAAITAVALRHREIERRREDNKKYFTLRAAHYCPECRLPRKIFDRDGLCLKCSVTPTLSAS